MILTGTGMEVRFCKLQHVGRLSGVKCFVDVTGDVSGLADTIYVQLMNGAANGFA